MGNIINNGDNLGRVRGRLNTVLQPIDWEQFASTTIDTRIEYVEALSNSGVMHRLIRDDAGTYVDAGGGRWSHIASAAEVDATEVGLTAGGTVQEFVDGGAASIALASGETVQDFVTRMGYITPELFGNIDGTNDQTQINAAIAYVDAQGGGEVWLPGQYVVSTSGGWNVTNGDLNACIRVETTNPVYLRGINGVTKITQVGTRIAHTVAFGKRVGTNVPSRGGITNCWIVGNREAAVSEGIPYEGGIGISVAGPGYDVEVSGNVIEDAYAYGIGFQRAWWRNCRCERNVIRRSGNDGIDCKFDYAGDLDADPVGTLEGGNANNWIIDNFVSDPAMNWASLVGQKAGIDVREGWNTRGNKIYASTPVAAFRTQHDDEGMSTPELDAGAPDTDNTRIRWQGSHEGIEVFFAADAVHTGTDGSGAALESRGLQIGTYASQFDNVRLTRGNYGVWCRASRAIIAGLKTRDCSTGLAIYGNSIEQASNVKVFGGDLRGSTYDVRIFGVAGYLPTDTGLHGVTADVVNIAAGVARTALIDCDIASLTDDGTDTVRYGTTPARLRAGRNASQYFEVSGDGSANYLRAYSASGSAKPMIIEDVNGEGFRLLAPTGKFGLVEVGGVDVILFDENRTRVYQRLEIGPGSAANPALMDAAAGQGMFFKPDGGIYFASGGSELLGLSSAGLLSSTTAIIQTPTDSTAGRLLKVGASATVLSASPAMRQALGGTANAITLTTGAGISGTPPTGMSLRFRATSANTGAATIAVDGGAAIACRTVTGVALPAGYIRTYVDTTAIFDGTYWVLSRAVETGSGANGTFLRYENGAQRCYLDQAYNASLAGGANTGDQTWTFPAAFASGSTPALRVTARATSSTADRLAAALYLRACGTPSGATSAIYVLANTGASALTARADLFAIGNWY